VGSHCAGLALGVCTAARCTRLCGAGVRAWPGSHTPGALRVRAAPASQQLPRHQHLHDFRSACVFAQHRPITGGSPHPPAHLCLPLCVSPADHPTHL
jgi:hypothetical protein